MDIIKNIGSTSVSRKVTVKGKSSILMPIINWISVSPEDGDIEQDLVAVATAKMNVVSQLEVTVNGIKVEKGLERYRARSPVFDLVLPKDNILGLPTGPRHFVSDGYWLFFTPLEKNIKLSTFGSCSAGVNKFLVDYEINVLQ